ncbi:MAG: heavy-metal-associated domain-containing protein [Verrucomicrobiales bacterium]
MKAKLILIPFLALGLTFSTSPVSAEENAQVITMKVEGMTCGGCAKSVRQAISACEGVKEVSVDMAKKTFSVTGENMTPEVLVAAVTEAGYQAEAQE